MKNIIVLIISVFILLSCSSEKKKEPNNGLTKKANQSEAFSNSSKTESSDVNKKAAYQIDENLDLKLTPFIPPYKDLGDAGKRLLSSRLNQALSNYAFGGDGGNPRFIIGPDINLLSKNLTATSPTKYANTYEVTLLSLDVESETSFASYSFTIKGVGDTPAKAFINGLRETSFKTEEFYNFLKNTQDKIAQYYKNNCDKIILEAESEAKIRNYDNAFTLLNSIPIEASDCFEKAIKQKQNYFKLLLKTNCQPLLSKMKAELGKANDPSASGFNPAAMSYYAMIDPASDCYSEAEMLYNKYLKQLNPKAKRDWDLEMKKYQDKIDKVEREDTFKRDSVMSNFEYLKHKDEMQAEAEIKGNKKLLQKYQYDQLPWLRKVFHLGDHDPFDGIDK